MANMNFLNTVEAKITTLSRDTRVVGWALVIAGIALLARYGVVQAQEQDPDCATNPRAVESTDPLVDGTIEFRTCSGAVVDKVTLEGDLMNDRVGRYIGPRIQIKGDQEEGSVVTLKAEVDGRIKVTYMGSDGMIVTVYYDQDGVEDIVSHAIVLEENVAGDDTSQDMDGQAGGGLVASQPPELPTEEPPVEQNLAEDLAAMNERFAPGLLACIGGVGALSVLFLFLAAAIRGNEISTQHAAETRKWEQTRQLKRRVMGHALLYILRRYAIWEKMRSEDDVVDAEAVIDVTYEK